MELASPSQSLMPQFQSSVIRHSVDNLVLSPGEGPPALCDVGPNDTCLGDQPLTPHPFALPSAEPRNLRVLEKRGQGARVTAKWEGICHAHG